MFLENNGWMDDGWMGLENGWMDKLELCLENGWRMDWMCLETIDVVWEIG